MKIMLRLEMKNMKKKKVAMMIINDMEKKINKNKVKKKANSPI
jgi:hypothetical protein